MDLLGQITSTLQEAGGQAVTKAAEGVKRVADTAAEPVLGLKDQAMGAMTSVARSGAAVLQPTQAPQAPAPAPQAPAPAKHAGSSPEVKTSKKRSPKATKHGDSDISPLSEAPRRTLSTEAAPFSGVSRPTQEALPSAGLSKPMPQAQEAGATPQGSAPSPGAVQSGTRPPAVEPRGSDEGGSQIISPGHEPPVDPRQGPAEALGKMTEKIVEPVRGMLTSAGEGLFDSTWGAARAVPRVAESPTGSSGGEPVTDAPGNPTGDSPGGMASALAGASVALQEAGGQAVRHVAWAAGEVAEGAKAAVSKVPTVADRAASSLNEAGGSLITGVATAATSAFNVTLSVPGLGQDVGYRAGDRVAIAVHDAGADVFKAADRLAEGSRDVGKRSADVLSEAMVTVAKTLDRVVTFVVSFCALVYVCERRDKAPMTTLGFGMGFSSLLWLHTNGWRLGRRREDRKGRSIHRGDPQAWSEA
jgi:hypothetical protein